MTGKQEIVIELTQEQLDNIRQMSQNDSLRYLFKDICGWDGIRWFDPNEVYTSLDIQLALIEGELNPGIIALLNKGPMLDQCLKSNQVRLEGLAAEYYQENLRDLKIRKVV